MRTRKVIHAGFLLAFLTTLKLPLSTAHAQAAAFTYQRRLIDSGVFSHNDSGAPLFPMWYYSALSP